MALLGRKTIDNVEILELDAPPYLGGQEAPIGSFAIITDGSEICIKRGAGDYDWTPIPNQNSLEEFEDFNTGALGATSNRYGVVAVSASGGSGTLEAVSSGTNYSGMCITATGTSNNGTGRSCIDFFNSTNRIRLGGFPIFFEARVRVPVLSGTPGFDIECGLVDGNGAGDPANGIFFYYTNSVNTGRWRAITRNASTATNVDSTVTVTANQWYKLQMFANAAGTSVLFYIDGVFIGSSSTNIPTGTGLRPILQIEKTTTSTTSRTANVDYVTWRVIR